MPLYYGEIAASIHEAFSIGHGGAETRLENLKKI